MKYNLFIPDRAPMTLEAEVWVFDAAKRVTRFYDSDKEDAKLVGFVLGDVAVLPVPRPARKTRVVKPQ